MFDFERNIEFEVNWLITSSAVLLDVDVSFSEINGRKSGKVLTTKICLRGIFLILIFHNSRLVTEKKASNFVAVFGSKFIVHKK